ncbi:MAG TPA: MaoC family dehydratase N-terminal domain-containing protein [Candidatus Nanopelagicaceae bacterium]
MLNPDLVGRTFEGATSTTITAEAIATFAQALGEPETELASPTFAITISLEQSQSLLENSGLDWSRVVHGDQRFLINKPLVAGVHVTCNSTIESARVVAGNEIVTVRSDLIENDEVAVSSWSTLVFRA